MLPSLFHSHTYVNSPLTRFKRSYYALAACLFFFGTGRCFLAHLGFQNDEALFGAAIFEPRAGYMIKFAHSRLPIMLMSYVGTLKSWIYAPIFRVFGTGVSPVRDPMLLAGVASVWLFFLLLRRTRI